MNRIQHRAFNNAGYPCDLLNGEPIWLGDEPPQNLVSQIMALPDDLVDFMAMDLAGYPDGVVQVQTDEHNRVYAEEYRKAGITPETWMLAQLDSDDATTTMLDKAAVVKEATISMISTKSLGGATKLP